MVKKKKIGQEVQELIDKKLSDVATEAEEIGKLTLADFTPKCKKCSGLMDRINPSIDLPTPRGILELHECLSCGEREYL